jgi:hypothetical protein
MVIKLLNDNADDKTVENSLKTLLSISKNTGYVIIPFFKYLNLLDVIIGLIVRE